MPTARERALDVAIETLATTASYWLPERMGRRLRQPPTVRRQLRRIPLQTVALFGMKTLAASMKRDIEARRERLRTELGREPTDEELQAAFLEEHGIDPPACDIPR